MEEVEQQQGQINPNETRVETTTTITTQAPTTGRRTAFKNVIRQLTDDELKSPAVQKIILDELEQVETERDEFRKFLELYHSADKRACILEEKLKTNAAIEVAFGVGLGLGGTLIGLTPSLSKLEAVYQFLLIGVGIILVLGAIAVRFIKR